MALLPVLNTEVVVTFVGGQLFSAACVRKMLQPALQLLCWKCVRIILMVPIQRPMTVLLSLTLETTLCLLDHMGCTKAQAPSPLNLSSEHEAHGRRGPLTGPLLLPPRPCVLQGARVLKVPQPSGKAFGFQAPLLFFHILFL